MKFNFLRKENKVVTNYEGAQAYTMTPAEELYSAVVTTGLSNTAYEKGNDRLARIQSLILKNDPEFVAKLAVYARKDMYLRSIPLRRLSRRCRNPKNELKQMLRSGLGKIVIYLNILKQLPRFVIQKQNIVKCRIYLEIASSLRSSQ